MIKKILIFTAISLPTLFTVSAFSFDRSMQMTGDSFSDVCTRANESWISFCNGYIQAAVDSLRQGDGVCIPNGTSRTDLVTAIEKTITDSNQLRTMNAHDAVRVAMRQAYSC
ncbi:Rap1a/Tai family immunity protein [Nitratireductor aquimarinus]|uniref:Rap1a/Tai family immunity protein n=1 Tax=Nitratireductor aquimarinus TaxID=889300 RepID=UPI00398F7C51